MEKITVYRAFDGSEFNTELECVKYEKKKAIDDSADKAHEIIEIMKNNHATVFRLLGKIREYCAYFGELGTCKGCMFTDEYDCCLFGDMPESIEVQAIMDLVKENEDE